MWAVWGLLLAIAGLSASLTQPEFDCTARRLAFQQAVSLLTNTTLSAGLGSVYDALQLSVCGTEYVPIAAQRTNNKPGWHTSTVRTLHVSPSGDDSKADGTAALPFATLTVARDSARAANAAAGQRVIDTVAVAAGRYVMQHELVLGAEDSGLTIEAAGDGPVVLSGGLPLNLQLKPLSAAEQHSLQLSPRAALKQVWKADLPSSMGATASLYEDVVPSKPLKGRRLPWARTPNGKVEEDLQPSNMAKARGQGSTPPGPPWPRHRLNAPDYRYSQEQLSVSYFWP
jgi:hypothetical protein